MSIYRGMVFIISKGQWVNAHQMSEGFKGLARGNVAGIPNLIFLAMLVFLYFYHLTSQ
jgi:rhamnose transport system permease protein